MTLKQPLLDRINNREAVIGIVGLGYVGLPLAVEFAEAGFRVIGVDITESKVKLLNDGESYIPDVPSERLQPLVAARRLTATTDYEALRQADSVNICVPTPLNQNKEPDMSFVTSAIGSIAQVCQAGMLVILESTTYPGTTQELILPRLAAQGFTVGEDIFLAFSGERIDPGNKRYTLHNTPKVIGGVTPDCTEVTVALYQTAVQTVVPVASPAIAEMAKLLENTFRAVNIGFINEIAIMCDRLGIDPWEVIAAASTKPFGFMPFYPGPGLGGHCIPIDPHYLSWKLRTLNYNARFIELASEVNTSMPSYVIDKITDALNDAVKPVRNSRIVVLGVAYKPDIDDVRESPALDILDLLCEKGADVCYHDPYVPKIRLGDDTHMQSSEYSDGLLDNADCVVIVTDHSSYDWQHVLDHSAIIVDTRHVTQAYERREARVVSI
jgi:UDP-N-acetyl-D-glucosamine dehydrogenase